MSILGILVGVLNCVLLAAVLVLVGAIIVWVAQIFEWPIPWNIQRIYLLICLLVFIICVISMIAGAPMVHFFGKLGVLPFQVEWARTLPFGQQLVSPRQLA
jgi:hypothetical protein